jgi:membrane-associated phospholipid phosphatase
MKYFFKNNAGLLLLYLIVLCVSVYFIFSQDRDELHLFINHFVGNRFLNLFFYYITYIGDGRFAAFLLLIIFFLNVRNGIWCTASFLLSALLAALLKYAFFDDWNRPHFNFQYINRQELNVVEGIHLYIHNSFPSGHATQAFAILMCLAFSTSNQPAKFLLFFIALITAFSRVYLSQHWLHDITAGSFLGFLCSFGLYFVFVGKQKFDRLNRPAAIFSRR